MGRTECIFIALYLTLTKPILGKMIVELFSFECSQYLGRNHYQKDEWRSVAILWYFLLLFCTIF